MRRSGFTLLEVILVLVIVVIAGAMAYPQIEAMYADVRLTAAADQVRARWADARTQAIEESRAYRFAIKPASGDFRIAPDSDEFWNGGGEGGLQVSESLPTGVNFSQANGGENSDDWSGVVTFLPDGTAKADVEIVFESKGARSIVLKLRALTGAVSVRPLDREPEQ